MQRPFTYHSCDTQHTCTVVHDICLLLHMKQCCLVSASIRQGFLILLIARAVHAVQPVYYGHIGIIHKCTDYQGVPDYSGQFTSMY